MKDTHEDIKISPRNIISNEKKRTQTNVNEGMEIVTRVVNEGKKNIKEKTCVCKLNNVLNADDHFFLGFSMFSAEKHEREENQRRRCRRNRKTRPRSPSRESKFQDLSISVATLRKTFIYQRLCFPFQTRTN